MILLQTDDIGVRFGGVSALEGVSLNVETGSIHGLIGPNGAGKTTFINVLSGLIPPTRGAVHFNGHINGPWKMEQTVELGIVRTFQQTRAFLGLTVRENMRVAAAAANNQMLDNEVIASFGLDQVLDRRAGDLPYASLRRLGIALALALKPKLLLLDEPAVGLTPEELVRMSEIIRLWNRAGVTILLVEHNMRFLMALSDKVSVLARGRLLFEGTPRECQTNQDVIDVYLGATRADVAH